MDDRAVKRTKCFGPEIWAAAIAMVAAMYAAFVYAPYVEDPPAQRIFYFHVSSAWVSFLAFFVTFVAGVTVLLKRSLWWDSVAVASTEIGTVFCTIALISGSIWAKAAWGVWWAWDVRLATTFALWLIYAAYIVLRMSTPSGERAARFGAVYAVIGFLTVPLVFMSIRLWKTQHPAPVLAGGEKAGLEPEMRVALVFCIVAFTLLYFAFLRSRFRIEQARRANPWSM